jgi:cell division protein FtsL
MNNFADLQTAFYTVGIVFMGLMLLLMLATVIAVLVIRKKITKIQHHIEERLSAVRDIAETGEAVVNSIKKVTRKRRN